MEAMRDGILLRVFIGEADQIAGQTLYRAIVEEALKAGLAGATVLHGPLGYGQNRRVNSDLIVDAPGNLPVIVEIVDLEHRIHEFLPRLDTLVGSGLVTLEKVQMIRTNRPLREVPDRSGDGDLADDVTALSPASGECPSNREELAMDVPHEAVLLRIFTSAADRYGVEEPLYLAIVTKARDMHLAGATVLKGPLGYGQSSRMHQPHVFAADDSPIVIEICDAEEKINAFLPVLDGMMESGLVTLEAARVLQYGRKRSGYLERLKQSLLHRLHLDEAAKPD